MPDPAEGQASASVPVEVDNVWAGECRMPQEISLDDIENCWPRWQRFKQSFKIFMLAAGYSKLAETRKAAMLLNCIGQQAQDLYLNTLKTGEEDKVKLEEIIGTFDDYFRPKQNEVINSYNLNKRSQEEGETFDAFYTAIRKLAENCNFGEQKNRMLRDRIVIGIRDQRMQQKLLEIKDLTLENAVDICRSAELSKEHVKRLNNPEVHAVKANSSSQHQRTAAWESKAKYQNNKSRFSNNRNNNNNNRTGGLLRR